MALSTFSHYSFCVSFVGSLRRERRHEGGGGLSVLLGNGYERSHVLWVDYMSNSDY